MDIIFISAKASFNRLNEIKNKLCNSIEVFFASPVKS